MKRCAHTVLSNKIHNNINKIINLDAFFLNGGIGQTTYITYITAQDETIRTICPHLSTSATIFFGFK